MDDLGLLAGTGMLMLGMVVLFIGIFAYRWLPCAFFDRGLDLVPNGLRRIFQGSDCRA
jgi:hypothetical protein